MRGRIFDIKKFAVHDGPGIRSTLFLKGCPLSCIWCHNPEGIKLGINLWFFDNKCIRCGSCTAVCPKNALTLNISEKPAITINHELCDNCGLCTEECPTKAISFDGWEIDADEAVGELMQDQIFYQKSGGGITLSGGDPLLQHKFSLEVLKKCREKGVHTAIETSMYADDKIFKSFFDYVDLFIVDLKLFDNEEHKKYTGTDNSIIHSNFKNLIKAGKNILVRIPLIPGITATDENIRSIGAFVYSISPETEVELINFNPLAENKYRLMGGNHKFLQVMKPYSEEQLDHFYSILSGIGINTKRETSLSIIKTERGE